MTTCCCLNGYAQKKFELLIETDNKRIESISISLPLDSIFYESVYDNASIKKNNDTFLLSGKVNFPSLFELKIDSLVYSQPFIIYPGKNKIRLTQIKSEYKVIRSDHHRADQDIIIYSSWFENLYSVYDFLGAFNANDTIGRHKISSIRDSLLQTHYDRTDSTLYLFSKDNPQSYYSLWHLNRLLRFGYEPLMSDIFQLYDTDLQNSYLGKLTSQIIKSKQNLQVGNIIPNGVFQDVNKTGMNLHERLSTGKLTLFNFWYSDCAPCLAKLPYLKSLLAQHQDHGFRLIHISTDKEKDGLKWKNTIEKYAMNWLNLLDVNKLHASLYGVEVFPFTFLVDETGTIIKINPTNSELEGTIRDILK